MDNEINMLHFFLQAWQATKVDILKKYSNKILINFFIYSNI